MQVGHNHHLAADEFLRLIGSGDAGDNLPYFIAQVYFEPQEPVCPFTGSAACTWPTRKSTLAKSSMVMVAGRFVGSGALEAAPRDAAGVNAAGALEAIASVACDAVIAAD